MDKLTQVISVKVTPEMEHVIKAIAKSEGISMSDMGRALFAIRIEQAREKYLASRALDSIFSQSQE